MQLNEKTHLKENIHDYTIRINNTTITIFQGNVNLVRSLIFKCKYENQYELRLYKKGVHKNNFNLPFIIKLVSRTTALKMLYDNKNKS